MGLGLGVMLNFWLLPEDTWGTLEAFPSWSNGLEPGINIHIPGGPCLCNIYGVLSGGLHELSEQRDWKGMDGHGNKNYY